MVVPYPCQGSFYPHATEFCPAGSIFEKGLHVGRVEYGDDGCMELDLGAGRLL